MIKGVNRTVIEVNRPDSVYFERAVLYLRPNITEAELALAEDADCIGTVKSRRRVPWRAFFLGAALSAAVCTVLILLLR